ncbi:MAG: carboxypeptidase-like regulatory domain-containing protein [Crocinitomicaceae bacterium]|nr:carboxypeptidase-like regulatory domain-containing protein [Crocinitomicaceae bacterium]
MLRLFFLTIILIWISGFWNLSVAQGTVVEGFIRDGITKERLPFVNIQFKGTSIGTMSDTSGYYMIKTKTSVDSLVFSFLGYQTAAIKIEEDKINKRDIFLYSTDEMLEAVEVKAPEIDPAYYVLARILKHKDENDPKRLEYYQYELYNKIQMDLTNLTEKFQNRGLVKKLDMDHYVDSTQNGYILPIMLTETLSEYYFKKNPRQKKEVIKASRVTGVDNLQVGQFLGDMYFDVNVYDNYLKLFNKDFISPIANFGKAHYRYYMIDTVEVKNRNCFRIKFFPKHKGEPVFIGDMFIDTIDYAVVRIESALSPDININYINDIWVIQEYEKIDSMAWMLTREEVKAKFNIVRKSKLFGFQGFKTTTRSDFKFVDENPSNFMTLPDEVILNPDASDKGNEYWDKNRHVELSDKDEGIIQMTDSLENNKTYKFLKALGTAVYSGYWPVGPIEIGHFHRFVSFNQIEGWRFEGSLRTSNKFSKTFEISTYLAYGLNDQKFKFGVGARWKLSQKKRSMLAAYFRSDIEQLGQSPDSKALGSTLGTLLRTGPLTKLTYVNKVGLTFERDWFDGFITFNGFEWKEYIPTGASDYKKVDLHGNIVDVEKIQTTELFFQLRYGQGERFISGQFDRLSLGSKKPIISMKYTLSAKGFLGSDFTYHKFEIDLDHRPKIGILGRLRYNIYAGYILGDIPYPFQKVHEGNQSVYSQITAFNNMNFFEFVSNRYVGFNFEHHLMGLIWDRIPGLRKAKLRTVWAFKMVYGSLKKPDPRIMLLPNNIYTLEKLPYMEISVGIENILNFVRVDFVWRLTHLDKPGAVPFGVRFRFQVDF